MPARRRFLQCLPAFAAAPAMALDFNAVLGAVQGATAAATVSDADIRSHAAAMARQMDGSARIAPASSRHAQRLAALTANCRDDAGLALNYKVYMTPEVNAFALPDGSIRLYAGLMDMMTDDEVRYVVGHEIGHVQAGHSKKRMQMALGSNAARHAAVAVGGQAGALAGSDLGGLVVKVVRAQHSQSNENEADDYAMGFLSRRKYDRRAAVTALEKLDHLGGGSANWLSTHPAPRDRANRMRTQLA